MVDVPAEYRLRGLTEHDARSRLGGIAVPSLIVAGDEGQSCPLEPSSRTLAEGIPDSTLARLPCGHFPMLEAADRFNRLVAGFLAERRVVPNTVSAAG